MTKSYSVLWRSVLLIALATLGCAASAEKILDVDIELRRAEEFRRAEMLRRSRQSNSRVHIDAASELRLIERGEAPLRHIAGARYRVAVFAFEDPDKTELGNALAALIGREILLRSDVGSIGVLRYQGSLAPSSDQPLSYFDKVELLVGTQDVTLALWGIVKRTGDEVGVEIYLQLPPSVIDESFSWSLRLPAAMGGDKLVAHMRPTRILVQRFAMPLQQGRAMASRVQSLDQLRAEPRNDARLLDRLPVGTVYWITRHEKDWIQVSTGSSRGWVQTSGYCTEACAPLLDGTRFAAALLQFVKSRRAPKTTANLSADAHAVAAQLSALEQLDAQVPGRFKSEVLQPLQQWLGATSVPGSTPPGGATFANIRALASMATLLQASMRVSDEPVEQRFNDVRLDPSRVHAVAFELAQASLRDPRNTDVLQNLAVLFRYAGDGQRAELADKLAAAARER